MQLLPTFTIKSPFKPSPNSQARLLLQSRIPTLDHSRLVSPNFRTEAQIPTVPQSFLMSHQPRRPLQHHHTNKLRPSPKLWGLRHPNTNTSRHLRVAGMRYPRTYTEWPITCNPCSMFQYLRSKSTREPFQRWIQLTSSLYCYPFAFHIQKLLR